MSSKREYLLLLCLILFHPSLVFCDADNASISYEADAKDAARADETMKFGIPFDPKFQASFDEWSIWADKYPMCNPTKNPNLGPINIETKLVIPDKGQTLVIYSGDPIPNGGYTFNTRFLNEGSIMIDAVTIGIRNEKYREATYISGLGNSEHRFFQRAIFLFSYSKVESQRSLHRIDNKSFPMEIVLYFTDIRQIISTQIHIMVQIGKVVHPGLHWLPYFLANGLDSETGIDDSAEISLAKQDLIKAQQSLEESLAKEKNATNGDNYEDDWKDLQELYNLVRNQDESQIEKLELEKTTLEKEMKELQRESEELGESKIKLEKELQKNQELVQNQISQGVLLREQENSDTDKSKELSETLEKTSKDLSQKKSQFHFKNSKFWGLDESIHDKKEVLNKLRIGNMSDSLFPNVGSVQIAQKSMYKQMNELNQLKESVQDKMNKLENALVDKNRDVPIEVDRNNVYFQISWLFPSKGGYYRYNGSSLLPPCTPKTHVIVLQNPITIHETQFNIFSSIPKGRTIKQIKEGEKKTFLDKMIPPYRAHLSPPPLIYLNKKNIQFKLDDGLHMRSSLRRKLKGDPPKSFASPTRPPPPPSVKTHLIPISLLLYFLLLL